ncbi:UNVERIFIED_CONTAM: hypothetical protein Sindi_1983200, partial [Sesamum indicum]
MWLGEAAQLPLLFCPGPPGGCLPRASQRVSGALLGRQEHPKRVKVSSMGTPPTGSTCPSATPPRDSGSTRFKPHRSSSGSLYTHRSLDQEREEEFSLAVEILKGVLTSEDKRLLSLVPQEDLSKMISFDLVKVYTSNHYRFLFLGCSSFNFLYVLSSFLVGGVPFATSGATFKEDQAGEMKRATYQAELNFPNTHG